MSADFTPPAGWVQHRVAVSELLPGDVFERVTASNPGQVLEVAVWRAPEPLTLPTEIGTVIAIGGWRFVLLDLADDRVEWVLLPAATCLDAESVPTAGFIVGAPYPAEVVLAEAEADRDGFTVLASPTTTRTAVAKDVIDFLDDRWHNGVGRWSDDVADARAKWGVQ